MSNPVSNNKLSNCTQHNEPILYYAAQNGAPLCQTCIFIQGLNPYDKLNNKLDELLIQGNIELDGFQQQLWQLLDLLLIHKHNIILVIEKILQFIMDQIKSTQLSKVQFQNLIQPNMKLEQNITIIESELNIIQNRNQQVKVEINQLIMSFQQKFNIVDYMLEMFKQNPKIVEIDTIKIPEKIAIQEVKMVEKDNSDKFEYELIREFIKKENNRCYAFAFNSDNTTLLVGLDRQIIVYEFNNGKILKELKRLSNHADDVTCLYFMKSSIQFVSGNKDIIIWSKDENNQWAAQQILNEHENKVFCFLMNNQEDLLISGSYDEKLKFWQKKKNASWKCTQTIHTKMEVNSISLNEKEDKLIVCGNEPKILIFEIQQNNQSWILDQTINIMLHNWKQFAFQPEKLDYLEVYDYDKKKKQFSKIELAQVQKFSYCEETFPCQFIKQLNILTVKHGSVVNILKINEGGKYQLIQKIKFETQWGLHGRMTDDGKYLITWDNHSREIQVRQLKYKND